ncbi:uncharacterized protein BKCO1_19000110 [Diplodia corticola]|uniref:N-acetyltransferase domain-containing protein n=1 Tax=Diplodia corticola TaxID=236234 RepID=A0A1J9RR07_9PEZI|nr:uncharacterized protein BKCO1_19000110 [Diplodia corticola]OJD34963.1 hypothetical protein BKCO1_19000110 [Diplodia corticola]
MVPRPPWAQQSDIWNSLSEAKDDRKPRGLRTLDQTNGGEANQLLTDAERRIALELYETHCGGPYPRLEAYAYEQFISPSAENKVISSNQIGSCTGQIFNREHALSHCFSISSQNAGFQTRTFLLCAYDEQVPPTPPPAGTLLPQLVEPAEHHFPSDPAAPASSLRHDDDATPLTNHHLVSEHSFILIEKLHVAPAHRRRGVGRALLAALLDEATSVLPSIRFAVSWPCARDDVDDDDPMATMMMSGGGDGGRSSSEHERGQRRAEAFHRAAGFGRVGLTRFWGKRVG